LRRRFSTGSVIGPRYDGTLPGRASVVFALGLALWLPLLPRVVRVVDGFMIGIGGLWLAAGLWRSAGATIDVPGDVPGDVPADVPADVPVPTRSLDAAPAYATAIVSRNAER